MNSKNNTPLLKPSITSAPWQVRLAFISSLTFLGALALALLLFGLVYLLFIIKPNLGSGIGMLYSLTVLPLLILITLVHALILLYFVIFHATHKTLVRLHGSRLRTIYGSAILIIPIVIYVFIGNSVSIMLASNERAEQTRGSFISIAQAEGRLRNCEIEEIRVLPLGYKDNSTDPNDYYIRMWGAGVGNTEDSNTSIDNLEQIRRIVSEANESCPPVNIDDYTYYRPNANSGNQNDPSDESGFQFEFNP